MSDKDLVRDLLEKLPGDVSLTDIAREVEFLDGVREGLNRLIVANLFPQMNSALTCGNGYEPM